MITEQWIEKTREEAPLAYLKALYTHLSGRTEESQEIYKSL